MTAFVGPWGMTYAANLTPDKNTGLGSEVRLYYADAVAFLGFDQGITVPSGKKAGT